MFTRRFPVRGATFAVAALLLSSAGTTAEAGRITLNPFSNVERTLSRARPIRFEILHEMGDCYVLLQLFDENGREIHDDFIEVRERRWLNSPDLNVKSARLVTGFCAVGATLRLRSLPLAFQEGPKPCEEQRSWRYGPVREGQCPPPSVAIRVSNLGTAGTDCSITVRWTVKVEVDGQWFDQPGGSQSLAGGAEQVLPEDTYKEIVVKCNADPLPRCTFGAGRF